MEVQRGEGTEGRIDFHVEANLSPYSSLRTCSIESRIGEVPFIDIVNNSWYQLIK